MKFAQVWALCDNFWSAQPDEKCRQNLPEKCPNVGVGPNFNYGISSQLIFAQSLDVCWILLRSNGSLLARIFSGATRSLIWGISHIFRLNFIHLSSKIWVRALTLILLTPMHMWQETRGQSLKQIKKFFTDAIFKNLHFEKIEKSDFSRSCHLAFYWQRAF